MKTLIIIPARYGSTRLPGKPLADLAGIKLIDRVIQVASLASENYECDYLVATDHEDILNHVKDQGVKAVMTPENVNSGSDRCLAAVDASGEGADLIINLQGDVPFTPPQYISSLIDAAKNNEADIFTLGLNLSWGELDQLREHKKSAPFSGTTCVKSDDGNAIWFSKQIIPAIRKEANLRAKSDISPVTRHIGIYGYKAAALQKYVQQPPSFYEELEGLEQLRALEAGMKIHISIVDNPIISMSGIDTQNDIDLANTLIEKHGDPHLTSRYL